MPFTVPVTTIAECLRTDCNVLRDNNKKKVIGQPSTGYKQNVTGQERKM
jgi:hypothetical protein